VIIETKISATSYKSIEKILASMKVKTSEYHILFKLTPYSGILTPQDDLVVYAA